MKPEKLPKHIIAHESIDGPGGTSKVFVLLKNTQTNKYYSVVKSNSENIRRGVSRLNAGKGWAYHPDVVGKQIVF